MVGGALCVVWGVNPCFGKVASTRRCFSKAGGFVVLLKHPPNQPSSHPPTHPPFSNVMGPQPRLAPSSQQWIDGLMDPAVGPRLLERMAVKEEEAPYPGARQILQWEVELVLHSGPYDYHPKN